MQGFAEAPHSTRPTHRYRKQLGEFAHEWIVMDQRLYDLAVPLILHSQTINTNIINNSAPINSGACFRKFDSTEKYNEKIQRFLGMLD